MTKSRRKRRTLASAFAAVLLLATTASAGFPTFDIAAFGQRVHNAITNNAQLAGIASLITNTTTMINTLDSQLNQAFEFAEGRIGALTNWTQMFPVATVLGAPGQVQGWISRASQVRTRAEQLASGMLAALPTEADIRGAWASAPVTTPIGSPVVAPPAETRADIGARIAQERADVIGRLDALTSARAAAAERNAQLLEDIRQRLEGIAADPGVSATALQQKQISAAAASGDLLAAQLQLAALQEELAVEEAAAQREAVAAHQAAAVAGVEAAFNGTAAIMARYDAAGADDAFTAPQLPAY